MTGLTLKESFGHLARLEELKRSAHAALTTVTVQKRQTHFDQVESDGAGRLVSDPLPLPYRVETFYRFLTLTGEEIARLKHAIKRANLECQVAWTDEAGRPCSIDEARLEAQRLREEIALVSQLGALRSDRSESWSGVRYTRDKDGKQQPEKYKIITEITPTFDTEQMRKRAIQLEKKVNRLSSLIEQAEVTALVPFTPVVDVYLTLEEQLAALEQGPAA